VIIGGHGAQAQTLIPPSAKDFVMAASQNDQYEVLAASVASVQGQDRRVRNFRRNPPLESLLAAWQPLQLRTEPHGRRRGRRFAHDNETPTETSAGSASIGCDPHQRFLRWVSSIGLVIVRQT
jgi:hypothetical protein